MINGITPEASRRECKQCPVNRCYGCPRLSRDTVTTEDLRGMFTTPSRQQVCGIPFTGHPAGDATDPSIISVKLAHVYYTCPSTCDDQYCNICQGGLKWCKVCGQAEGELTEYCPGYINASPEGRKAYNV